jgi:hypothetical protein
VTKKSKGIDCPVGKVTGMVASSVINIFDNPSNRQSAIGDMEDVGILLRHTKSESMKQWVDPLSMRALKETQLEG